MKYYDKSSPSITFLTEINIVKIIGDIIKIKS